MAQVKLRDGVWVNPKYVTCIQVKKYEKSVETLVWVVKDAGYGTGSISFTGDVAEDLAMKLNKSEEGGSLS